MNTLIEFIQTGRIHDIALGDDIGKVISALGQPETESMRREPLIIKYGDLELTFKRRHLILIHISIEHAESVSLPHGCTFKTPTLLELCKLCEISLTELKAIKSLTFDTQSGYIYLPSAVQMISDPETDRLLTISRA